MTDSKILPAQDVAHLLTVHPEWSVINGVLERTWSFRHFRAGFAFVTEAALLFERHNHHGDVTINYRHVCIRLISHDVKGITQRDADMIAALDKIYG